MMKARAGDTVIIGLSDMNLEKLREGKPILFDGSEIRVPGVRVVIFHAPTEADMERLMAEHFIIPGKEMAMGYYDPESRLALGEKYPYGGKKPTDWAERAAQGVLADLGDRGGIKHELGAVDQGIQAEIVEALSRIIRLAGSARVVECPDLRERAERMRQHILTKVVGRLCEPGTGRSAGWGCGLCGGEGKGPADGTRDLEAITHEPDCMCAPLSDVASNGRVPDSPLPALTLAEGFGDPETLLNSRDWMRKAIEAKGAKVTAGGVGMGQADLDFTLEGCSFNISLRPVVKNPSL